MIGGLIGGMVTAFVTIFKKTWAPLAAPLYALLEGLVLGGISAVFEKAYPGIAVQAVGLTFGTLFVLLLAYKSGVIRATQRFKTGVIAATGGIAVFYLVAMLLSFFHVSVGVLYSSSPWGIAFSVFVVIVARAQSGDRLRHDRDRRTHGRSEVHGMVRRVRPDGHADLAVSGNSAPARESPQKIAARRRRVFAHFQSIL